MSTHRQLPAFTLIEVLVVVAIIALLISILLPSLELARREGRKAACLANLDQLGTASIAYLGENKGRYCWGTVDESGIPRFRTWLFGGNRATGKSLPWWTVGNYYDWPPEKRALNRYVAGRRLGDQSKLKIYECPSDKGGGINTSPLDPPTPETAYEVFGTSYQANGGWSKYARDPREGGWGEGLGDARILELFDSIIRIFEKKGASRAVLLYEDRADICLSGAKEVPAGLRIMGWHGEANRHSMLFLDGHAANLYVAFKKVMDHNEKAGGGINYFCNPATDHCLNGTSDWVTRQDYLEH